MKCTPIKAAVLLSGFALTACSSPDAPATRIDSGDARYATLLNMDLPTFYGTLTIAGAVSNECNGLNRNPRIDLELNERRNKRGNGSFAALTQRAAIRDAQTSMTDGFKSRNGSNLCAAAQRVFEMAREPYTFFLERSGGS